MSLRLAVFAVLALLAQVAQCINDFESVEFLTLLFIENRTFPGNSIQIFTDSKTYYENQIGNHTYPGDMFNTPVTKETLFDMASVTKVVSTTSAIMKLYEAGRIGLQDKMVKYIPLADNHGKGEITIENLLLHNAGLPVNEK